MEVKLGEILASNSEAKRDAIHVGVVPVRAGGVLRPAQKVKVRADGLAHPALPTERFTGIVDPFLFDQVGMGDLFWLLMAPGEVNSLRHDWDHEDLRPEVEAPQQIQFVEELTPNWDELDEDEDDGCRGCYS